MLLLPREADLYVGRGRKRLDQGKKILKGLTSRTVGEFKGQILMLWIFSAQNVSLWKQSFTYNAQVWAVQGGSNICLFFSLFFGLGFSPDYRVPHLLSLVGWLVDVTERWHEAKQPAREESRGEPVAWLTVIYFWESGKERGKTI